MLREMPHARHKNLFSHEVKKPKKLEHIRAVGHIDLKAHEESLAELRDDFKAMTEKEELMQDQDRVADQEEGAGREPDEKSEKNFHEMAGLRSKRKELYGLLKTAVSRKDFDEANRIVADLSMTDP